MFTGGSAALHADSKIVSNPNPIQSLRTKAIMPPSLVSAGKASV
jgi:hypothetical protein